MPKSALIFGRAQGVWDEIAQAQELGHFDCIVAVGSAGIDWAGRIDCWVTFHSDVFFDWVEKRQRKRFPPASCFWSCRAKGQVLRPYENPVQVNYITFEGGSSGLIAVMVMLEAFQADRIVLAGVPMDADAGQYDSTQFWTEAVKHRQFWELHQAKMRGKVKSMSGWTQGLLGAPTREWLKATEEYVHA